MMEERVTFHCGAISLEGILSIPTEGHRAVPAVAVCHPHPLYGGNMNNGIVHAVCIALSQHSIASLRFNFRGTGKSGGSFDEGIGEQEDVKAALSFLENQEKINASRLGLCGYSFGTMVGIPVADSDERVQAYAGVSSFFTAPNLFKDYVKPKFFIHGTADDFTSCREIEDIVSRLPNPKSFVPITDADHFWWGREKMVGDQVAEFFENVL